MSFICEPCHIDHYGGPGRHFSGSYGPCGDCGERAECHNCRCYPARLSARFRPGRAYPIREAAGR